MPSSGREPASITGELPVSLTILTVVNKLSILYMKIKGILYILVGLSWIVYQSPSREAGIAWLNALKPEYIGFTWICAGLISIIFAFFGSTKMKRLAFFALIMAPALVGFYFLISWVAYLIPFTEAEGYSRAGISTLMYWAFAFASYIMARIYSVSHYHSYGEENRR